MKLQYRIKNNTYSQFFFCMKGGPVSSLVQNNGKDPEDGVHCIFNGIYCNHFFNNTFFYPCNSHREGKWYKVMEDLLKEKVLKPQTSTI